MKDKALIPLTPTLFLVPLTKGFKAVVSDLDADYVGQFKWYAAEAKKRNTVYGARRTLDGRIEYLHRAIGERMGLKLERDVDHIDGNGLHCWRLNLRDARRDQNMRNTGLRANNKSGVKGVHWHALTGKWCAQISSRGIRYDLGLYDQISEAAAAVSSKRSEIHGEFSNNGTGG